MVNLPINNLKTRVVGAVIEVFDPIRKKYVVLTPEEWVRQNFIKYLVEEKHYPASLMAVEKTIVVNKLKKRCDVVIYGTERKPLLMVECKASNIKINQNSFDQIARYNLSLDVKYLIITNGINHFCCTMDKVKMTYDFLEEVPTYQDLVKELENGTF